MSTLYITDNLMLESDTQDQAPARGQNKGKINTYSKAEAYLALQQESNRIADELDVKKEEQGKLQSQLQEKQAELERSIEQLNSMRDEVAQQVAGLSELFILDGEVATGIPDFRPLSKPEVEQKAAEMEKVLEDPQSVVNALQNQIEQLKAQIAVCFGSTADDLAKVNSRLTEIYESMDGNDLRMIDRLQNEQELRGLQARIEKDIGEYELCCIGEFKSFAQNVNSRCGRLLEFTKNEEVDISLRINIAKTELSKMDSWARSSQYIEFGLNALDLPE